MNEQPEIRFEEILVVLEMGTDCRAPVAFAADLAAGLKTRLAGLWIEDQALHRAAGYAFTREITIVGGVREFSATTLSRDLSAQRETLRRLLARHGARRRVEWRLVQERLEETGAANRLVIAAGAALRALPPADDVMLFAGRIAPGPVSLVLTGGADSGRALRVARRIAEATDQPLQALLFDAEKGEDRELRSLLAGITTAAPSVPNVDPAERLRRIAASRTGGLLVVPRGLLAETGLDAAGLAKASAVPVLLAAD